MEKHALEKLLGMGSGYVLDFSNRTFEEFVADSTGKNIWDHKYDYGSGSKANRLRAFWTIEPNHVAGKLIADLLEYYRRSRAGRETSEPREDCQRIVQRLSEAAPVFELEALSPNSAGRDFESLAKSVRDAIERNEPESGLDRLHTFVVKYIRVLCTGRGISTARDKPIHSLFGEYVRSLKEQGLIESDMTERILKSSISTMEAFNRVRNEHSYAHDNPVLNYDESLLIFNHVASAIRFVGALEDRAKRRDQTSEASRGDDDDVPF
jgi:abortive infection Abi-like protein